MGVVANVGYDQWPRQSDKVGKEVIVYFNYNTSRSIMGIVRREDMENPGKMIIELPDGRFILSTECQYSFPPTKLETPSGKFDLNSLKKDAT